MASLYNFSTIITQLIIGISMKTFKCDCQNHQILFFESKFCISCNQVVGIDDDFNKVEPYSFDTNNGYYFKADKPTIYYKKCDNITPPIN